MIANCSASIELPSLRFDGFDAECDRVVSQARVVIEDQTGPIEDALGIRMKEKA